MHQGVTRTVKLWHSARNCATQIIAKCERVALQVTLIIDQTIEALRTDMIPAASGSRGKTRGHGMIDGIRTRLARCHVKVCLTPAARPEAVRVPMNGYTVE
jgi:hypothetical protein|eukprot:COSAG06_NODE_1220_length_10209_cov_56.232443_2_plen_101_part_00